MNIPCPYRHVSYATWRLTYIRNLLRSVDSPQDTARTLPRQVRNPPSSKRSYSHLRPHPGNAHESETQDESDSSCYSLSCRMEATAPFPCLYFDNVFQQFTHLGGPCRLTCWPRVLITTHCKSLGTLCACENPEWWTARLDRNDQLKTEKANALKSNPIFGSKIIIIIEEEDIINERDR